MSYDKSADFKQIQADVLTIDTTDNEKISSLKQLKTSNKSVTKAINALNEQLGNAQTSASDAVQRVVALEEIVAQLRARLENGGVNNAAEHVIGMVLAEEGGGAGTWVRVDRDFNTVDFDPEHGTWAGMKTVTNDTYGEFVEIPVTYVKTETLTDGPYAGKNCWWVADGPEDGFHVHPAFIGQDGQPHNLQIASWITSNKGGQFFLDEENDASEWQGGIPFSEDKGSTQEGYWGEISYNVIRTKGWMDDGVRPYNVYDHHLLARLMLIEFGTPDIQAQIIDDTAWTGETRINYHDIHDPFGLPEYTMCLFLDGFTTLNGTYQVLAADGSLSMVETGINCNGAGAWPINCRVDKVNNIDFGDLFIANMTNKTEDAGSFADYQSLFSDCSFFVGWYTRHFQGAFFMNGSDLGYDTDTIGWRISRCI